MLSLRTIFVALIIALYVLVNITTITTAATVNFNSPDSLSSGNSTSSAAYPNITINLINGKSFTITQQIWNKEIMPLILYDRHISTFNWSKTNESTYIFFDYSLRGLNPFGAEFVFALEKYSNVTTATITDALLSILSLPSVNAPYTNGQALNLGILPGLPSTSLIKSTNPTQYYPEIVIISLITLVIILHFIFKKI